VEIYFLIWAALFLDLLLGDPRGYPHPVRVMGWAIERLEGPLRQSFRPRLAGAVLWAVVTGSSFVAAQGLILLGATIHRWVGLGIHLLLLWTALALRDLDREARDVYEALKDGDLLQARRMLSRIVGRDTEALPRSEVIRAAVESVAENTVDGVLSPIFYALLGGAPFAMAFKAVSTLDSMVGHRDERYREFGTVSARADDLLNFLPARVSACLIPVAAALLGMKGRESWRCILKDRKNTPSPNAGIPEAAFAGALGIALGGPISYGGKEYVIPTIGVPRRDREPEDILRAIRLAYLTTFLFLLATFPVCLLVS